MSEKMLVTQALDERDLLVKKINDKIAKASFVDTIKPNEDNIRGNIDIQASFSGQMLWNFHFATIFSQANADIFF